MKKSIFTILTVLLYSTAFPMETVIPWAHKIQTACQSGAAAGALIFAKNENNIYVLLGHRGDQDFWCNPGGMAEDKDMFSWITAVREVREETMGFYAFMPEQLKGFPSHCLYIPSKKIVYTMYLAQANMIPIEKLNERLAESTGDSREYREFKWVLLKDLLIHDQKTLKLMDEFSLMIKQEPILQQLNALITTGTLITAKGTLHTSNYSIPERNFKFEEFEKEDDALPLINSLIDNQENLRNTHDDKNQSPASDDEISSLELKCFTDEEKIEIKTTVRKEFPHWNSCNLSPTQAYLKLVLGKEYKDGSSRDFLKRNLSTFIESMLSRQSELSRKINVDSEGMEKLADIFEFELKEYNLGRPVMYHGLDGSILFFYQYVASLHSIIKGEKKDTFGGLRGTHIPFINKNTGKPYKNIFDVFDVLGIGDYGKEHNTVLMCVNPILVLGPGSSSLSTSSSLEYFFNSHSVGAPPVKNLMLETLVLLGMHPEFAQQCYEEFYSLYEQFYRFRGSSQNGGLLAISMPSDLSKTHALVTSGGGKPYIKSTLLENGDEIATPSIIQMIMNVQKKAMETSTEDGGFMSFSSEEQKKIKNLTNEARIYLDPTKQFKVEGRWHYDLSQIQQQLFSQHWNIMLRTHLSRLFKTRTMPIENCLIILNQERYLIRHLKEKFQLSPPQNILHFLIEKGWTKVIENYLNLLPDSLNPNSSKIKQALWTAIVHNHQYEVISTLDKYLAKLSPSLSSKDLLLKKEKELIALYVCELYPLSDNFDDTVETVKMAYDFLEKTLTAEQKEQIIFNLLKTCHGNNDINKVKNVFSTLGLDKTKLFESFFIRTINRQKFGYDEILALLHFIDIGISFDQDDEGKARFKRLLSAQPKNVNSIDFYNWFNTVQKIIEKHNIDIKNYPIDGDKALLYKIYRCFGTYWKCPDGLNYVDGLNEFVFTNFLKNGFLHSNNIYYDQAYQYKPQEDVQKLVQSSLAETRPYSMDVIKQFFCGHKFSHILRRQNSAEEKLAKFERALTSSQDLTQVMTAIEEIDDIGILFLNLKLMDDNFKRLMQRPSDIICHNDMKKFDQFGSCYTVDNVHLFTDRFFLKILEKEKKCIDNILDAIKTKKEDKILELSKSYPVYVMKYCLLLLLGSESNTFYAEALLMSLKRILAFNSHLFYEPIDILTNYGDKVTYDCDIFHCIISKVINLYQSDTKKHRKFLTDFFSIPVVQEKLIDGKNLACVIGQLYGIEGFNSCENILSLFPDKAEAFRKSLNNSTFEQQISLICMVFEDKLSSYNMVISDFLNKEINGTSLKNKDITRFVEDSHNGLAFKNWIEKLQK